MTEEDQAKELALRIAREGAMTDSEIGRALGFSRQLVHFWRQSERPPIDIKKTRTRWIKRYLEKLTK